MFKQNNNKKYLCTYHNKFKRDSSIADLINDFYNKKMAKNSYKICGRVFRKRIMGKATFLALKDASGEIQLFLSEKNLTNYKEIITYLSLGDIIGTEGCLFETKTKELSLKIYNIIILSKNINTFPDKRVGLVDKEMCYRQRYLDLITNDDTKKIFINRSKIISEIRHFFLKKEYIEIETPIIQTIPGGADAKPFKTYNNYMNTDLYLRISPELYLKRIIIGGIEKVFEIGKSFRNESLSNRHHPEFTTIEFYEAYSNYKDLIKITEELLCEISKKVFNTTTLIHENTQYNFSKNFEQISFYEAITKYTNITTDQLKDKEHLKKILDNENLKIEDDLKLGKIQSKIFEHFVEKNLIQPTFVLYHPVEISPLARQCDDNLDLTERFELYINGKEIANGFSELNDPFEQEKRFKEQIKNKNPDLEYDIDYLNALKYALPPTAGEGIGIDRLIMLFTNSASIKDVILFPIMKIK